MPFEVILAERLFFPLGMDAGFGWPTGPRGHYARGGRLRAPTEDAYAPPRECGRRLFDDRRLRAVRAVPPVRAAWNLRSSSRWMSLGVVVTASTHVRGPPSTLRDASVGRRINQSSGSRRPSK